MIVSIFFKYFCIGCDVESPWIQSIIYNTIQYCAYTHVDFCFLWQAQERPVFVYGTARLKLDSKCSGCLYLGEKSIKPIAVCVYYHYFCICIFESTYLVNKYTVQSNCGKPLNLNIWCVVKTSNSKKGHGKILDYPALLPTLDYDLIRSKNIV